MKKSLRSGIVALITVAFSTANMWAAHTERARLTIADNKVTIAGQPAASGTTITAGDTIVTGRRSHTELTLPDGSVVRIGQGSSFTFTGSKLVLNQGSALVRVAHKNTTVTTPARTYTGGPSVISAQASKGYDGIFVLQGAGKVNGQPLIAGQTSVLDKGRDRTFSFDLQKLVRSSALVTQFPQTPWIVQTEALASIQHQLLAGKIVQAAQPANGGQLGATSNATSALVSSRAAGQLISKNLANLVSSGAGGVRIAGNPASGGSLTISAGSVSLGSIGSATFTGATISVSNTTSGLTINGNALGASAGTLQVSGSGALTNTGSGTLTLNGAGLASSATGAITYASGGNGSIIGTNGTTTNVANTSATISAGTNTFTGTTNITNGILTSSGNVGTLVLSSTGALSTLQTSVSGLTIMPGNTVAFGGVTLPQQAGQNVTIYGATYVTVPVGTGGALRLQPVAH